MVKADTVDKKDQKIEKSSKKTNKSSYSKKKKVKKNILNGSLLVIDNFNSDYTFSIFLKKILPEYSYSEYPLSVIAKNNPYKINFENMNLKTRQIFIREKLRILAIQDKSLLSELNNENLDYTKFLATVVFNYLIGN